MNFLKKIFFEKKVKKKIFENFFLFCSISNHEWTKNQKLKSYCPTSKYISNVILYEFTIRLLLNRTPSSDRNLSSQRKREAGPLFFFVKVKTRVSFFLKESSPRIWYEIKNQRNFRLFVPWNILFVYCLEICECSSFFWARTGGYFLSKIKKKEFLLVGVIEILLSSF